MPSFKDLQVPTSFEVTPTKFYALAELANNAITSDIREALQNTGAELDKLCQETDSDIRSLGETANQFLSEVRRTTRRKNPFKLNEEGEPDGLDELAHSSSGTNFLPTLFNVMRGIHEGYVFMRRLVRDLETPTILLVGEKISHMPKTLEELQTFAVQMQMNEGPINKFVSAILSAETAQNGVVDFGRRLTDLLDHYYQALINRHHIQGIEVHGDPVATDLAMTIFENVDANGEIQDGKKPDEVSAYSVRKATLIAAAVREGVLGDFVSSPKLLLEFLEKHLDSLWTIASALSLLAKPVAENIRTTLGRSWSTPHKMGVTDFKEALTFIKDLDPQTVVYKEKMGMLTAEERKSLAFKNETLKGIVNRLRSAETPADIIQYILQRKHELRQYHLEVNSFFVCNIGAGNPFLGTAPGALEVVPGVKPNVNLDEVHGGGFAEVRDFIKHITTGTKWFDLFVATSPSKKADKSNVLLVGPQGSGKTEILRAVASDKGSIGIFAQASDFLTCWKGEAEKNPKRLFEAGLKIQRESNKLVFFLIDEIDTVLNGDRGQAAFGGTNLATEFQVLMDGITSYPSLAIWGATNHPERIPMPLIRRFAKVVVVGELDHGTRIKLLRQFTSFLPVDPNFPDQAWDEAAKKLEGAVGDIIRKVVDHLWRSKMGNFTTQHPEQAEKLLKFLNDGGQKFEVGGFTAERRSKFNDMLRPFVEVKAEDLLCSIDDHLSNVAIQAEIQAAVETYERSRRFLAGLNQR